MAFSSSAALPAVGRSVFVGAASTSRFAPSSLRARSAAGRSARKFVMVAAQPSAAGDISMTERSLGDELHNFRLERDEYVPEVASYARLWVHKKTGTELLSLSNVDENKTFGIVFRTPPSDSTGVPHILEHSVLCGSRKYPVKEPFVELIKASLNTFLNAFTYPDKTCYPVASCNEKDFYNLVDVYLDAVLHPNLTPDTLRQEGHHIEAESVEGPKSFKGVVYNEMKGAYSDADRVLAELSQRTLFPDVTYGVESGGHPRDIPDLTWEQFKGFHDRFYHPSNARMWFYGDDAEEKRLAKANEFLEEFQKRDVADSRVGLQPKWTEPRSHTFEYDAGSGGNLDKKFMATVNWMLPEVDATSPEDLLALTVLNHMMLATSASPLRKALIDSGLGEDLVGGGVEMDLRQMAFSIGLKGMDKEGPEKMKSLLRQELEKYAEEGFSQSLIDASLNTIEFRLREKNTGGFPKGLSLMLASMTTWLHEADPLTPLRYETPLAAVKERLENGEPVFQELIKSLILDNPHNSFVTMKPDPKYAEKEDVLEAKKLQAQLNGLTDEDMQELVDISKRLKEKQAAPDDPKDLAKIPTLGRSDLDKLMKFVPFSEEKISGATVLNHPLVTNGIVYFDLTFDFSNLTREQLQLAGLLSSCLTELGTKNYSFVDLKEKIGTETGGIRSSTMITQEVSEDGRGTPVPKFVIRGKAMKSNSSSLFDLIGEIVTNVNVDNRDRLRQYLIEEKAGVESGIVPSGHMVAASRLRAMYRVSDWATEQLGGVAYLSFLREILERVDNDWDNLVQELKAVQMAIFDRNTVVCNVTCPESDYNDIRPALTSFVESLPGDTPKGSGLLWVEEGASKLRVDNEALIIPAGVNYVGKAANLRDMGFKPTGASALASKFLGTTYLWDVVRVQGGAYGGFCRLDNRSGTFTFLSYRDPNIMKTINAYDGAAKFLREVSLSDEELTKSIIGVIGDIDSYQLPDAKGFAGLVRYMTKETNELRQQRRDEVLNASVKSFHELGEVLSEAMSDASVVVVGGEEALKTAVSQGLKATPRQIL